jgi:hypothetical protein
MKIIFISVDENNNVTGYSYRNDIYLKCKKHIFNNDDELQNFTDNFMLYKFNEKNELIYLQDKREKEQLKNNLIIKIENLKLNLSSTDYKITKCYEAFMRQLPLPYNLEELSAQRDAWRAEINQLEEELKAL